MHRLRAVAALCAGPALVIAGCGASRSAPPGSTPSRPVATSASSAASGSPPAGRVVAQIAVGSYPDGITAAAGSLWTANLNDGSVSRIDPATRRVVATIKVPQGPISLLAAYGFIWTADYNGTAVSRIDPVTNHVTAAIRVGAKPVSIVLAGREMWVFNQGDRTASVLNPRTGKVIRTVRTGISAGFAAADGGLLWVPDFQGGSHQVLALSPGTGGAVRKAAVGAQPVSVGFGAGSGWAGNGPDDTVTRFDPATGAMQHAIATPADAGDVLPAGRAVWVTSYLGNELVRISATTNSVTGTVRLGSGPNGIVAFDGYLWVTESGADEVAVIRPG